MPDKNLSRDRNILEHIYTYQENLFNHLKTLNCSSSSLIVNNDIALELSAFAVLQIGELSKKLTDESRDSILFLKDGRLQKLRNDFAHNYGVMNKTVLASLALDLCKTKSLNEVKNRIVYCVNSNK